MSVTSFLRNRWTSTICRRPVQLLVLVMAFGLTAVAQNPGETNADCIKRLEMPAFPALARSARITGTISATVSLDGDAKMESLHTAYQSPVDDEKMARVYNPTLNTALKNSMFRKKCAGKILRIIFHFEIDGEPADKPKVTYAFGYPSEFWIVTEPATSQP